MLVSVARKGLSKLAFAKLLRPYPQMVVSLYTLQTVREPTSAINPPYFLSNVRCENSRSTLDLQSQIEDVGSHGISKTSEVTGRPGSLCYRRDLVLFKPNLPLTIPRLLKVYSHLSKSRLTFLIVLTSMSGFALSPLSTTVPVLLSTAAGTAFCSASANTLNQLIEVPFDAQMVRTRTRPLVQGTISPVHAAGFATVTGLAGTTILGIFVNPISSLLGMANIGLYAGVYTRLKRSSVINTWVGSLVGGIPPLIGWTACGGKLFPSPTYPVEFFPPPFLSDLTAAIPVEHVDNPLSALALFCLVFSWQFPHFNSFAHMMRGSYAQAGYKMLSVTNPSHNALVSFRHALALLGICSGLVPLSGLTTWAFAFSSLVPNAFMLKAAWNFWKAGTEQEARALWNISLWYLPSVLALMMFHKQGMEWLAFIQGREKITSNEDFKGTSTPPSFVSVGPHE